MTTTRARAYVRLRDIVKDRADLLEPADADRMRRAPEAFLFARSWRESAVVTAIAEIRDLAADLLTNSPIDQVAPIFDLLEAVAPADLADRTAVAGVVHYG